MVELEKRLVPVLAVALLFAHSMGEESGYRLTVKDGENGKGSTRSLRAEFCLEPAGESRAEVCLGAMKGYELWGPGGGSTSFRLRPGSDGRCVCETPVTLDARQPLCWPEWIDLSGSAGRRLELSGFVTLLEGVHEPGDSVESCSRIESQNVILLVKRAKPEI